MSETTPARLTARILIETRSVLFRPNEPFVLTSGRASPVYIDCRRLIAFPRARRRLMEMAAARIEETVGFETLDVVAGGETAGIPYAAWLADRLMLPMCYIRKKPKGFGRNARIEGDLSPGQRALLVEDLATDGGSKLSFIEGLREAGPNAPTASCCFITGYSPRVWPVSRLRASRCTRWRPGGTCSPARARRAISPKTNAPRSSPSLKTPRAGRRRTAASKPDTGPALPGVGARPCPCPSW